MTDKAARDRAAELAADFVSGVQEECPGVGVVAVTGTAELNDDNFPSEFALEAEPALLGNPMTLIPMLGKALGIVTQQVKDVPSSDLELMWGVIRAVAQEDGNLDGIEAFERTIVNMRERRLRAAAESESNKK